MQDHPWISAVILAIIVAVIAVAAVLIYCSVEGCPAINIKGSREKKADPVCMQHPTLAASNNDIIHGH